MVDNTGMSDIFISYASEDRERAKTLAEALEAQNWSVWRDRVIPAGRTFDEVIEEAIDAAKCIVVVWSEASVKSRWVRTEAEKGAHRGIFVPVLIENVRIPLAFRRIQAADLIEWDGSDAFPALQKLVADIKAVLGSFPAEVEAKQEAESKGEQKEEWRDPVTGMEFVWVPEGCFDMGSNEGESNEKPVHEVCVDGFWMGKYEVTQGQWEKVMGNNPSSFKASDSHPVETVSWNDVQDFIRKLNALGKGGFRLPTEAEWEYACRSGGKQETYCGGNDVNRVAWYWENSGEKTHPVGEKAANGLGLYDMSGNVWEWVSDWYKKDYYGKSPRNNPKGPSNGFYRLGFRLARTNP